MLRRAPWSIETLSHTRWWEAYRPRRFGTGTAISNTNSSTFLVGSRSLQLFARSQPSAILICFMVVTVERWEDAATWNQFVGSVPHAHFQQGWEWGELAPDLGGSPIRLAALRDGQMVGAMQVIVNSVGRSSKRLLYVPRGPALCEPSMQVLGPLVDRARLLGQERNAIGIRVEANMPTDDSCWIRTLGNLGFHPSYPPTQPRSSWMLD